MSSTRRHRLPQRLDFTLIPAPLDISLPLVDEKSPLPAIIVTPSSPIGDKDFAIAFLAPTPKPTLLDRLTPHVMQHYSFLSQNKTRVLLLLLMFIFVLALHVITHRLAVMHPRLAFDTHTQGVGGSLSSDDGHTGGLFGGWLGWDKIWRSPSESSFPRRFIVEEQGQ